ncbi:hypothetical protein [Streptomyces anulatus]|uniref:hypothetical protein n=1 Tax=Streptomyces anulatus TaxID=1892 RepID=UPI0033DFF953
MYVDHDPRLPQNAVSSVRSPGAAAAEAARRERATDLDTRLNVLNKQVSTAYKEWSLLDDASAHPEARAEVLTRLAALLEEVAALYEELTGAEPNSPTSTATAPSRPAGTVLPAASTPNCWLARHVRRRPRRAQRRATAIGRDPRRGPALL